MSLSTYTGLQGSVVAWMDVNTADVATVIADLVTVAEARINREARTRDNEVSFSTAISSGVIAVPTDYLSWKFAYVDGTPVQTLERRSAEWIYANYGTQSSSGKPKYMARDATNFIFGPYPNSGYTVKGVYYKKMAALSSSAHALFVSNPDLYLFGCLAESEIVIGRDSRIPLWEAKYTKILNDVNGLTKMEDSSGGSLQMRIG